MEFVGLIKISDDEDLNALFLDDNYISEASMGYTADLESVVELDPKQLHPTDELDGKLFSYIHGRVYEVFPIVFKDLENNFWVLERNIDDWF